MSPAVTRRWLRRETTQSSPVADRGRRPWWRDLRVAVGVALIVACALAGVAVLAADSDEVVVWRALRPLAAGAVPSAADLEAIAIPAAAAGPYLPADAPADVPLARDIRAGELLPREASPAGRSVRWVTVPVEPLHAPIGLAPGDRVDIWTTATDEYGLPRPPREVLAGVLVLAVADEALGLGGEFGVVVEIPPGDVGTLLAALRGGGLDLVRAPVGTGSEGPMR